MERIGCIIFAFDRPGYLRKTIESIYQSWNRSGVDIAFYLFQDGQSIDGIQYATNEDFNKTKEILYEYKEKFEIAEVVESEYNVGIGKQKYRAHQLFEVHDRLIFFEDDMIVSPYYIRLLLCMSTQFPNYVVRACDRTGGLPNSNFEKHLEEVIESNCHLWGYLMPKPVYEIINPSLKKYVDMLGNDYRKRPGQKIKEEFGTKATSHDVILTKSMKANDIPTITTKVPRAKYIGEQGLHSTAKWYRKFNFHIEKQYIFDEDDKLDTFKLIE